MSNKDESGALEQYKQAYQLQKKARELADQQLEEKSRELYLKNESLKQAIEQLQLQQSKLITQEKLASVGQVGASLAHELNNPTAFVQNNLVSLQSYVSSLSQGLQEALSLLSSVADKIPDEPFQEALKEKTQKIRDEADLDYIFEDVPALVAESLDGTRRIASIANSLRYFANPDHTTSKPLDINECIQHSLSLIHKKDKLADIQLELSPIPTTTGLPMLLSQAIANLIQNAIEAPVDNPKVTVRSSHTPQCITIDVLDQGPGIDEDQKGKIFEPFFTTKAGHNGLGLGIAKQIVDQHQGRIAIEDDATAGTKVRIELPISAPTE